MTRKERPKRSSLAGSNKANGKSANLNGLAGKLHKRSSKPTTVMQQTLMRKLRESKQGFSSKLTRTCLGRGCCRCSSCSSAASAAPDGRRSSDDDDGDCDDAANRHQRQWAAHVEYSESQNSIRTLELFKYAQSRELAAITCGVVFMFYAASWQPISVFILAIMASLMGQYSRQIDWLVQLNNTSSGGSGGGGATTTTASSVTGAPSEQSNQTNLLFSSLHEALAPPAGRPNRSQRPESPFEMTFDKYSFLDSLHSFVTPIFDLARKSTSSSSSSPAHAHGTTMTDETLSATGAASASSSSSSHIYKAVHEILEHESNQFLRKSFEINGSAFLLALTQLFAFFLGMTLITWAAKKQASRIKVLYFNSCLHQDVTWFEAIDSASGSGSVLNGLVEKYEDGVGMKLALLCYFLGHVMLFAATAFYQMFSLAAFCMPFVLLVGLIIAYLSERQARAIGQHALFAKRSLQLAEEIIAAIRTVFAFNGQQKELTRYSLSFEPVYRKSLIKHLYTALNTSLSKFSIFACFAAYCFYAKRLFPPHSDSATAANKATILAVMRGAEVSIVNILISIPFVEALQQSKGSIARIYVAIERHSRINSSSGRGLRFDVATPAAAGAGTVHRQQAANGSAPAARNKPRAGHHHQQWQPSISFRMVHFGYADRSGPTRRRSTLPFLNLPTCTLSEPAAAVGSAARRLSGAQLQLGEAGQRRRSIIDELTDSVDELDSPAPPTKAPANRQRRRSSVVLVEPPSMMKRRSIARHLENERHGGDKRILSNFNLEIKAGQSVAFVGPSGAGKSTVLALVQRLYDITGGQLLIGQRNIKDLSLSWLRNQIGVVAQEPRLFDLTIAENIMLGLSSEQEDLAYRHHLFRRSSANDELDCTGQQEELKREKQIMQQVVEAAQASGAHEFISKLPNGYATRVGSGGVQLSGGQKQRIAIARALIRKPKILLLDECTSALDTESEAHVQAALKASRAAGSDRTTLIVAHRLATIRDVDLIVVINEGQVVECGSHDELMQAGGDGGAAIYKQMYEEQLRASGRGKPGGRGDPDDDGEKTRAPMVQESGAHKEKTADLSERAGFNSTTRAEQKSFEKAAAPQPPPADKKRGNASGVYNLDNEDGDGDAINKSERVADERRAGEGDDASVRSGASSGAASSAPSEESAASSSALSSWSEPGAWQLWQFVEMPKWTSLAAMLVCLLAGLILPLNLIAHSYLFSVFAYNELDQIGEYLHVFGLLILSFSTFVFIVSFLQVILPGFVGEKLSARLSVKTMDSLLQKPMFYFDMDSNSAGSLCNRFNSCVGNLQSIAGTRVAVMLEAVSTLLAGAFFGFGQSLELSLFCLSFALLVLVTTVVESRLVEKESRLQRDYDAQLAHLMADALANIKTIASLNRERFFIDKFRAIIAERERCVGRLLVGLRNFLTSLKFVMPALSWSASMYYGCRLLASGQIDLQTIFIVCPVVLFAVNDTFRALVFLPELLKARQSLRQLYGMNMEFSPQVLQTLTLQQQLEEQDRLHQEQLVGACGLTSSSAVAALVASAADATARRDSSADSLAAAAGAKPKKSISFALEPIIDESPAGAGGAGEQQVNRRLSNLASLPTYMNNRRKCSRLNSLVPRSIARGSIEFRNVEFAYPNRPSALVLDDFSLRIEPGESVALVGGSGSGKSTTVTILEKFYDYHAGEVRLDGRDLRLVEPSWVRSQIGLVQQEPCLLSYTIGDNIRYGDNSRFVAMDEVVEAARTANIHEFIMSLPDQYDTELTSSAYSGCQLSGGQRQRIAIARALVRQAPILIFDEATSALDNRSEKVVQDALAKARQGRTSLTIAHRLATIEDADKIVVLREGRVVEQGRHEELLARPDGYYRQLWERQESGMAS